MAKPLKPVGRQRIMPIEQKESKESEERRKKLEEESIEPEYYGIQEIPQSPMLTAFMEQTGLDYNNESLHYDGSEDKFREISEEEDQAAQSSVADYMAIRGHKSSSIRNTVEYPHQVNEGDLDDTTASHEHFKDYDHSLEQVRHLEDLQGPPKEPEGFRLLPKEQD
jgi:hypothetical protein